MLRQLLRTISDMPDADPSNALRVLYLGNAVSFTRSLSICSWLRRGGARASVVPCYCIDHNVCQFSSLRAAR